MIPFFDNRQIVLASASPRRLELLQQIGIEPLVAPSPITEESDLASFQPAALVELNASRKAQAATPTFAQAIIIGADTVVIQDGRLFGKPADDAAATAMLHKLAGQWHTVYTGICLIDTANNQTCCGNRATQVRFAALTAEQISAYVASGEPRDKAGAYGIQGLGGLFVEQIRGDYGTVVGLSLPLLRELAENLAFSSS